MGTPYYFNKKQNTSFEKLPISNVYGFGNIHVTVNRVEQINAEQEIVKLRLNKKPCALYLQQLVNTPFSVLEISFIILMYFIVEIILFVFVQLY